MTSISTSLQPELKSSFSAALMIKATTTFAAASKPSFAAVAHGFIPAPAKLARHSPVAESKNFSVLLEAPPSIPMLTTIGAVDGVACCWEMVVVVVVVVVGGIFGCSMVGSVDNPRHTTFSEGG